MQNNGFVKVFRNLPKEIQEDPLKLGVLTTLLLKAAFAHVQIKFRGLIIELERGELVTTYRRLARELKLNLSHLRRLLKQFQSLRLIKIKAIKNRCIIIKILVYDHIAEEDTEFETFIKLILKEDSGFGGTKDDTQKE